MTGKTASEWLDQLGSKDRHRAHRAVLRLGGLGAGDAWMLDELVAGTRSRSSTRRFWALTGILCLARHGIANDASVTRLLVIAARGVTFGEREVALSALGQLPRFAATSVTAIARALRTDRSAFVRAAAARSMGSLGRRATPGIGALIVSLDDRDAGVRVSAAIALKFVPTGTVRARRALERAARRAADEEVRRQLEVALRRAKRPR